VSGLVSIFQGDVLLADVPVAVQVDSEAPAEARKPAEVSSARPYRRIFASYSHKDAAVVEQFERYVRTLGDEYFQDWKTLRSGEVWDERLCRLIDEADVFQLFWSRNAMESEYVRREYEYALGLKRPHFVRPTYWEEPLPKDPARKLPPEELLRLHFQRLAGVRAGFPGPPLTADRFQDLDRMLGQRLEWHQAPLDVPVPIRVSPPSTRDTGAYPVTAGPASGRPRKKRLMLPALAVAAGLLLAVVVWNVNQSGSLSTAPTTVPTSRTPASERDSAPPKR
jgi:hypothetical protein